MNELNRDTGPLRIYSKRGTLPRIDCGLHFEKGFEEKVDDFAREFDLVRIALPGGTDVAEGSYKKAKRSLLAAGPECVPDGARICRFDSKVCMGQILAFCRMTMKKILGD